MTKEEIARAKELDLLTYFKLVEPGNLKLVGKEYRHKVHSSLTISKDSLSLPAGQALRIGGDPHGDTQTKQDRACLCKGRLGV